MTIGYGIGAMVRCATVVAALLALAGCETLPEPALQPTAQRGGDNVARPRINGTIRADQSRAREFDARGVAVQPAAIPSTPSGAAGQPGDITLNFVDTDIREIVRSILGTTLKLNYTIDPNVHGTATLETGRPLNRTALLGALETLLNQNGATVIERNGIYQVVPLAAGAATNNVASGIAAGAGTQVVTLRYASAKDLAKLLEPFIAEGGKIAPDPARNAIIVSGDAAVRQTLVNLISAFDVDILAGQSYALFPVGDGNPAQLAGELEKVFLADHEGPLSGVVRVLPMERINAVLVVTTQARYIDEARRFFSLANRAQDATARAWHVYYVQNGQSSDLENLLQRAFTPDHVTSSSSQPRTAPIAAGPLMNADRGTGTGGTDGTGVTGIAGNAGSGSLLGNRQTGGAATGAPGAGELPDGDNPGAEPSSGGSDDAKHKESGIRIIANRHNNALLIYANPGEYAVIEGMLRKVDIIPLQVLIEATIAEVTLNDALQYGTQFFLREDHVAGILSQGATSAFANNFPGFVLTGGAHIAINALAQVSRVKVLSSPEVMVLDNEPARLQVGALVPVITGSAQSTLAAGAPIVNNVDYRETGVIMLVTPRVNSGGLVTLDVGQEVSDVATTTSSTINSPTFNERLIRTRVAVQDGQTIGMAGLIRDSNSEGNSGFPWLKDIPILGSLASEQSNSRERTELLVLITPHVVHDQRDARALTDDIRNQLKGAALVPQELNQKPLSGSPNPNVEKRR